MKQRPRLGTTNRKPSPRLNDNLIRAARAHLITTDRRLAQINVGVRRISVGSALSDFEGLVEIVVGQQLSGAAAETIMNRVRALCRNGKCSPAEMLRVTQPQLRECGVSRAKSEFIRGIAIHALESRSFFDDIARLDDDEAFNQLVKLRGVGDWTAGIFLLFNLKRTDVFPRGDGTLMRAINKLYGVAATPEKFDDALTIANLWRPYRSVAALMLWSWMDSAR